MGDFQTVGLGAVAGATILLGLPVGRVRATSVTLRAFLNALAVGVLLFLLWDVLAHAWEPVDAALAAPDIGAAIGDAALLLGGLGAGLLGLAAYEDRVGRRTSRRAAGPGAMVRSEPLRGIAAWSQARRTALLIAVGIGLHNFAEGLAIGGSAARGEIGLAAVTLTLRHNHGERQTETGVLPRDVPRRRGAASTYGVSRFGGTKPVLGSGDSVEHLAGRAREHEGRTRGARREQRHDGQGVQLRRGQQAARGEGHVGLRAAGRQHRAHGAQRVGRLGAGDLRQQRLQGRQGLEDAERQGRSSSSSC